MDSCFVWHIDVCNYCFAVTHVFCGIIQVPLDLAQDIDNYWKHMEEKTHSLDDCLEKQANKYLVSLLYETFPPKIWYNSKGVLKINSDPLQMYFSGMFWPVGIVCFSDWGILVIPLLNNRWLYSRM